MQHNFVGKLSGGEKRRLQLLRVLMANPNFLILDEPTNDLDITTLNVLEDYLQSFAGCLIIVSHDRYFMDRLVDHLFVFEGNGKIRDFPGNYTDYREKAGVPPSEVKTTPNKSKATISAKPNVEKTRKLSYNEQRELEKLDKEIPALEKQISDFQILMTQETAFDKLQEISAQLQSLEAELDEKEMRWLELND